MRDLNGFLKTIEQMFYREINYLSRCFLFDMVSGKRKEVIELTETAEDQEGKDVKENSGVEKKVAEPIPEKKHEPHVKPLET